MSGMSGYDKQAAMTLIAGAMDPRANKSLKNDMPRLISDMIDADIAYMHLSGALDETGDTGEGSYDEDDAFEYILETLVRDEQADDSKAQALAALINDFLPAQGLYLERAGLVTDD
jgi:hypothetical protein